MQVTDRMVGRWYRVRQATGNVQRRRGRKVCINFEHMLANRLLEGGTTEEHFTCETIRAHAKTLQTYAEFLSDEKVQKLEFSDPWIYGFLERQRTTLFGARGDTLEGTSV